MLQTAAYAHEEINGYIERNHIPDELIDPLVRDA